MLYREMGKTGDKVSILGYGCMRFPRTRGRIDQQRTEKQVIFAIEQGINYFDTAYMYGDSESTLGRILAQGYREKVFIATKLPLPLVHSRREMEKILDTQLKRLRTDYVDYYLMHALVTNEGWQRLKRLGIEEFLEKAKQRGKIRRIGFSYHGNREQFREIVDDYGWDFCMIQYNYLDEHNQAGRAGLEYAAANGLGVAVMEPLRGGFLGQKMPPLLEEMFARAEVQRTPAEWALRWVWNHPQVSLLLSGMNEEDHIRENIRIAGMAEPCSLSENELELLSRIREKLTALMKVNCTGCGYCMPCPAGVDIPRCFDFYNSKHFFDKRLYHFAYLAYTCGMDGGEPCYASLCRECGQCTERCPQGLPIPGHLREVAKDLEGFYFQPAVGLMRRYYQFRKLLQIRRRAQG